MGRGVHTRWRWRVELRRRQDAARETGHYRGWQQTTSYHRPTSPYLSPFSRQTGTGRGPAEASAAWNDEAPRATLEVVQTSLGGGNG